MKTVRCFLAININLEVVRKLSKVQEQMIEKASDTNMQINWVPPQNIHITMRFLGSITEPMIQAIKDSLEVHTRTTPPLQIVSKGIGSFLNSDGTGVLWAGLEPSEELDSFHSAVCKCLENTGFKEKVSDFIPHATVARIKNAQDAEVQALVDEFKDISPGVSIIKNLVCYRSDISAKGADYKLLWRLPLSGRFTASVKEQAVHKDNNKSDITESE
jgi:2'-5' RNA ligase